MPSSRGSSQLRDQTQVSHTAGRFFTIWATRKAQGLGEVLSTWICVYLVGARMRRDNSGDYSRFGWKKREGRRDVSDA